MNQYLLLLKGKEGVELRPDLLEERLQEYRDWVNTIAENFIDDNRLDHSGAHIRNKDDIVTDGPFLESKEIIAGFVIIKAETINVAIEITNTSPLLKYFEIFVRPMLGRS